MDIVCAKKLKQEALIPKTEHQELKKYWSADRYRWKSANFPSEACPGSVCQYQADLSLRAGKHTTQIPRLVHSYLTPPSQTVVGVFVPRSALEYRPDFPK